MTDKKLIKKLFNEVLDERFSQPQGQHDTQHEWVKMKMEKERRWDARTEKWKTSAGGALIIGGLTAIGAGLTWVFNNFTELLHIAGGNHGN